MSDRDRLIRYANRFFERHRCEQWPTVRQAAKALNMRQSRVVEEAECLPLMLTYWNTKIEPCDGDRFLEVCE